MIRCDGFKEQEKSCPLKEKCYRFTVPIKTRDMYATAPYNFKEKHCNFFMTNEPSQDYIRTSAYYIWLREGCPKGKAKDHWEKALYEWNTSRGL